MTSTFGLYESDKKARTIGAFLFLRIDANGNNYLEASELDRAVEALRAPPPFNPEGNDSPGAEATVTAGSRCLLNSLPRGFLRRLQPRRKNGGRAGIDQAEWDSFSSALYEAVGAPRFISIASAWAAALRRLPGVRQSRPLLQSPTSQESSRITPVQSLITPLGSPTSGHRPNSRRWLIMGGDVCLEGADDFDRGERARANLVHAGGARPLDNLGLSLRERLQGTLPQRPASSTGNEGDHTLAYRSWVNVLKSSARNPPVRPSTSMGWCGRTLVEDEAIIPSPPAAYTMEDGQVDGLISASDVGRLHTKTNRVLDASSERTQVWKRLQDPGMEAAANRLRFLRREEYLQKRHEAIKAARNLSKSGAPGDDRMHSQQDDECEARNETAAENRFDAIVGDLAKVEIENMEGDVAVIIDSVDKDAEYEADPQKVSDSPKSVDAFIMDSVNEKEDVEALGSLANPSKDDEDVETLGSSANHSKEKEDAETMGSWATFPKEDGETYGSAVDGKSLVHEANPSLSFDEEAAARRIQAALRLKKHNKEEVEAQSTAAMFIQKRVKKKMKDRYLYAQRGAEHPITTIEQLWELLTSQHGQIATRLDVGDVTHAFAKAYESGLHAGLHPRLVKGIFDDFMFLQSVDADLVSVRSALVSCARLDVSVEDRFDALCEQVLGDPLGEKSIDMIESAILCCAGKPSANASTEEKTFTFKAFKRLMKLTCKFMCVSEEYLHTHIAWSQTGDFELTHDMCILLHEISLIDSTKEKKPKGNTQDNVASDRSRITFKTEAEMPRRQTLKAETTKRVTLKTEADVPTEPNVSPKLEADTNLTQSTPEQASSFVEREDTQNQQALDATNGVEKAVISIQRIVRHKSFQRKMRQESAAIQIQRALRARTQRKMEETAAVKIQKIARALRARTQRNMEEAAEVKIQKIARGSCARRASGVRRESSDNLQNEACAAAYIQINGPADQGTETGDQETRGAPLPLQEVAATHIQRAWRARASRRLGMQEAAVMQGEKVASPPEARDALANAPSKIETSIHPVNDESQRATDAIQSSPSPQGERAANTLSPGLTAGKRRLSNLKEAGKRRISNVGEIGKRRPSKVSEIGPRRPSVLQGKRRISNVHELQESFPRDKMSHESGDPESAAAVRIQKIMRGRIARKATGGEESATDKGPPAGVPSRQPDQEYNALIRNTTLHKCIDTMVSSQLAKSSSDLETIVLKVQAVLRGKLGRIRAENERQEQIRQAREAEERLREATLSLKHNGTVTKIDNISGKVEEIQEPGLRLPKARLVRVCMRGNLTGSANTSNEHVRLTFRSTIKQMCQLLEARRCKRKDLQQLVNANESEKIEVGSEELKGRTELSIVLQRIYDTSAKQTYRSPLEMCMAMVVAASIDKRSKAETQGNYSARENKNKMELKWDSLVAAEPKSPISSRQSKQKTQWKQAKSVNWESHGSEDTKVDSPRLYRARSHSKATLEVQGGEDTKLDLPRLNRSKTMGKQRSKVSFEPQEEEEARVNASPRLNRAKTMGN